VSGTASGVRASNSVSGTQQANTIPTVSRHSSGQTGPVMTSMWDR
jgi:hypothetical protein